MPFKIQWKYFKAKTNFYYVVSKENREMIINGGRKKQSEMDTVSKLIVDMIPQVFESVSDIKDDDEEKEDNAVVCEEGYSAK